MHPVVPHTHDVRKTQSQPWFIGSEIYRHSSYGPFHPLRVPRVSTVMDLCCALNWIAPGQYLNSPRAKPAALMSYHTPEYIAALQLAEATQIVSDLDRARHALGTSNNPVFTEMYRRPATSAGAAMLAGELLRHPGTVFTPAGGTHHGFPDRAGGFCYLNDPVLGIQSLRRNGSTRIAYLDIDAHHCDGVDHAFRGDSNTLLISTHEDGRWPRTGALDDIGAGNVMNIPLPSGAHDDDMALVRDMVILPALALFRLWSGNWAILNDLPIPDELIPGAQTVLAALRWDGQRRVKVPPPHWITTLRDAPRGGAIHGATRHACDTLAARLVSWT